MAKKKGHAARRKQAPGRHATQASRLRWRGLAVAVVIVALVLIGVWMYTNRRSKPAFDGERALADIVRQVGFGPRVPGSEAHRQTYAFLVDTLQVLADRVGEQRFPYVDRHDSTRRYEGVNLVASFNLDPTVRGRIMLAAHWDSRPVADQDPDPSRRTQPVPGANDGASGVAVLLEMARLLHAQPPDVGVDLVLFDLEDLGDEKDDEADTTAVANPFAIGSAYFAEHYATYRPTYGILLDMVCDRHLVIPQEAYSLQYARPIVQKIWTAAERVGAAAFVAERGRAVMDDHVPFLQQGIPVVNLIHTPFPDYWHTVEDTPDKCSAASLQQVGDVLVEVVYSE